jgi:hypothetical protein
MGLSKRIGKNEMRVESELSSIAFLERHDERVHRYGPENLL